MKTGLVLCLLALAAALPASAFAGKTSRSMGVKICKAKIEKRTPPPKDAWVVDRETEVSDTQYRFTFRLRAEGGAVTVITCTVDREAQTAVIAPKP